MVYSKQRKAREWLRVVRLFVASIILNAGLVSTFLSMPAVRSQCNCCHRIYSPVRAPVLLLLQRLLISTTFDLFYNYLHLCVLMSISVVPACSQHGGTEPISPFINEIFTGKFSLELAFVSFCTTTNTMQTQRPT